MPELHETAKVLARWRSRGGKWGATLVRNYAGAWRVEETKNGKPCGCMSRPAGFFSNDDAAVAWAREIVPKCFDAGMHEIQV